MCYPFDYHGLTISIFILTAYCKVGLGICYDIRFQETCYPMSCDSHVLPMCYPCDIHVLPMCYPCAIHVLPMCYPFDYHCFNLLTSFLLTAYCKVGLGICYDIRFQETCYPMSCDSHVLPMCYPCDIHVLPMCYPCAIHVLPMCYPFDYHCFNLFTPFLLTAYCKVGLGICYDIRFQEMAQIYNKQGNKHKKFLKIWSTKVFANKR